MKLILINNKINFAKYRLIYTAPAIVNEEESVVVEEKVLIIYIHNDSDLQRRTNDLTKKGIVYEVEAIDSTPYEWAIGIEVASVEEAYAIIEGGEGASITHD